MTDRTNLTDRRESDELSRWVGGALALGAAASFVIVAVGVVLDTGSITAVGLLLLVLTPAGHLLAALAAFVRRREVRYALAAATALALLLGAMALAALSATIGG